MGEGGRRPHLFYLAGGAIAHFALPNCHPCLPVTHNVITKSWFSGFYMQNV